MELFVEEKGGVRYTEEGEGEKRERRRSVTVLQRGVAAKCVDRGVRGIVSSSLSASFPKPNLRTCNFAALN